MKSLFLVVLLGFAVSLCGIAQKLKLSPTNENSGSPTAGKGAGSPKSVEKAQPTAAQTAALAGGSEVRWNQQGMSWTVPPKWTKQTEEKNSFLVSSPDLVNLIVSISPMDESFPVEASEKAFYDGAVTRSKNGEVDELKWLELDGLKGVQFRESKPEHADDAQRLQWIGYRKFAGQVQMVNIMLATQGSKFAAHRDAMYGILYSTKMVH